MFVVITVIDIAYKIRTQLDSNILLVKSWIFVCISSDRYETYTPFTSFDNVTSLPID